MSDDIRHNSAPAPQSNGADGAADDPNRDANGKFVPGNKAAVGRKHPLAARVQELKGVVLDALTDGRVEAVIRAMLNKAIEGDVHAARLVLEYGLGRPSGAEVSIGDGASFQILVVPAEDGQRITNALPDDGANPSMQGTCGQNDSTAESVVSPTQPQNRPYQAEKGGDDAR